MYLNIRGLKSKFESLLDKIDEVEPTIVCITETHLLKTEKVEIEGYKVYRNDRDNYGGGLLVGVKDPLGNICTIVKKSSQNEALWIVIDNTKVKLRIGIIYAPQESRTSKDDLKEMYSDINEQILVAKEKQQSLLLLGDFNCKIGDEIKGNKPEVTKGGKLLLKMVKTNKLAILNQSEKCEGLWTRCEGKSQSVLDYVITDRNAEEALEKMVIDESREFSPVGYDQNGLTYSDHNVFILKFNWIVMEVMKEKAKRKTIMTENGYKKYRKQLEERQVANLFAEDENANTQQKYNEWKKVVEDAAKRNSTMCKKRNPRRNIKLLIRKKRQLKETIQKKTWKERKVLLTQLKMVNEQIDTEKKNQFKERIDKVVNKLRSKNGINGPNMWEVMKSIRRPKTSAATAIKNKDGRILENPEEIKNRYLEHFVDILQPPTATTKEEKQQEKTVNLIFNNILNLANSLPPRLTTMDEIVTAKKQLKRNKSKDPYGWNNEMIMEGGKEMDSSLLHLFNRMEHERFSPEQWREVSIKAIEKPGCILEMDNKRGLFLTEVISKLYEKILKNRNAEKIDSYVSDFQSGGVKNRSTGDNKLILSEIIRQNKKLGRKTYIVYGDAVKCFDKLWLKDCLVELYKAECAPQDIQMMFTMNKDTVIEVVTPSGTTQKVQMGEIAKQRTVLGPTFCCVETDQINKIGEDQERMLGTQKVAILIFVDDVMSAGGAEDARKAIRNMAEMEVVKKFTYGLKKTNYMVVNSARGKAEEINEKVKGGIITEAKEYKYIGFWVNKEGNCQLHIEKKKGKMKGEIVALKSIASYSNMGEMFVNARLEMYEMCILPSLLYDLECWTKQSKGEVKKLEQIQAESLCNLLELPKTTPYIGLLCELGMWRIEERLMYRKLMFYNNLMNSDERRLAKRIVVEQQVDGDTEESFYATVVEMANVVGVSVEDLQNLPKNHLKKLIKNKLNERMRHVIACTQPKMKKMRFVQTENFDRQKYVINLKGKDSVQALRLRLNMIPIYGNYHGDIQMRRLCPHCEEEDDTTEHLLDCKTLHSVVNSGDLFNNNNIEIWKQILEVMTFNLEHRLNTPKLGKKEGRRKKCFSTVVATSN